MRRHPLARVLLALLLAAAAGAAAAAGCSAAGERNEFDDGGGGGATTTTTSGGGSGMGGEGGTILNIPDAGADATADVPMNPCGSECGPDELCDEAHTGLDDDCDGIVDEGCPCPTAGAAHFCFKGDPSYHNTPGCYDGTQTCTENGVWGPCIGGVHADENCFENNVTGCHPISAVPFQDVNLKDGTGNFSIDAVPGTEVWTVTCPPGVNPCPAVTGVSPPDDFKPLQSGEYTVTYTKGLQGGGMDSCTYPLFIGAKGLRVELEWEHDLGDTGVDLDLHLHQPSNTAPWAIGGSPVDCGFANCTVFSSNNLTWFPVGNVPPDPVNWYLDPVFEKNTCFYAPRGAGQAWQDNGMGCHNPRLDIDNITCDPAVVDSTSYEFCAPENINVDFPPIGEWFRIGVHYYSNHGLGYTVHPRVKIYCDGALAADLGSVGYYTPEAPVAFPASAGDFGGNRLFWMVADVAFEDDECGAKTCKVQPLYFDGMKSPYFVTTTSAESSFGPPYPP
jgi:hypothetical protein